MNSEVVLRKLLLVVLTTSGFAQSAIACNEVSTDAQRHEREPDNRTFLLDLQFNESGKVRAVQVLMGAGPLRTQAIKAAVKRTYRTRPGYASAVATIAVKFPQGRNAAPEVNEVTLGVSSCVYGGAAVRIEPILGPTWVNQLLSAQPSIPGNDSTAETKKQ